MTILALIALVAAILSLVLYPVATIVFAVGCIIGVAFSAVLNQKVNK